MSNHAVKFYALETERRPANTMYIGKALAFDWGTSLGELLAEPYRSAGRVRDTILEKIKNGTPNILLIGEGPAEVEIAGNVWRLVRAHKGNAQIILANSTDRLLPGVAARAGRVAEQSLSERGVKILSNFMAASMAESTVYSQSGDTISYDMVILAFGIVPPRIFVDSGLKTSQDGALLVNDCLQSVDHPELFGGADCIAIQGRSLDRVGVYAVREGPILFHNLSAHVTGNPVKTFRPQKRYLLILNLGDGTSIFVRWPIVWMGAGLRPQESHRYPLHLQIPSPLEGCSPIQAICLIQEIYATQATARLFRLRSASMGFAAASCQSLDKTRHP